MKRFLLSIVASIAALAIPCLASADIFVFNGGDLADGANWTNQTTSTTGAQPGSATGTDTATIDVNGSLIVGNTLGGWINGDPTLTFGGGAVITAGDGLNIGANGSGDWGHTLVASSTFNNATLNADDDIFANSSVLNFEAGSAANSGDDFEANGLSIININGGTHTAGDVFGAQGNNATNGQFGTVNLAGGTVTAGQFRVAEFGVMNFLAGDAILTGGGDLSLIEADGSGTTGTGGINLSSGWTGSWTINTLTGTDWQNNVFGTTNWTLDGVSVDAASFASNFEVTGGGTTLSLQTAAVPEPSSLFVLGLGMTGLLVRRRR